MLIKVILDLFISNIDQELFKGVLGKVFKSKDIQQSDNGLIVVSVNSKINNKTIENKELESLYIFNCYLKFTVWNIDNGKWKR